MTAVTPKDLTLTPALSGQVVMHSQSLLHFSVLQKHSEMTLGLLITSWVTVQPALLVGFWSNGAASLAVVSSPQPRVILVRVVFPIVSKNRDKDVGRVVVRMKFSIKWRNLRGGKCISSQY